MGAQHSTFSPIFFKNEGFQPQIWHFLNEHFPMRKSLTVFSTVKNSGFATAFPSPSLALLLQRLSQ